jgi:hypothetical protein
MANKLHRCIAAGALHPTGLNLCIDRFHLLRLGHSNRNCYDLDQCGDSEAGRRPVGAALPLKIRVLVSPKAKTKSEANEADADHG